MIFETISVFLKRYRKIIFFLISLCFVLLAYFIYYTFFTFHTTRISPDGNEMPTSYRTMVFTFNRDLKPESEQKKLTVEIDPYVGSFNYRIKKNTLTIGFDSQLAKDDKYSLRIKNLVSTSKDVFNFQKQYTVAYVEQKDLPKEDLEKFTSESDSFEKEYPLIKHLPIEDVSYTIEYEYPDSNTADKRLPIVISANFSAATNSPSGAPTQADFDYYLQRLRTAREQAIKVIEKKGFNREKYSLYFSEPYLLEEFNGQYIVDKL